MPGAVPYPARGLLDLLSSDTTLRRVASTDGGEYGGPCPFCGGDDRFRVWPNADHPHYWCRACGRRGDAIQYLRDHDGLSFTDAARAMGRAPGASRPLVHRVRSRQALDRAFSLRSETT